MINTVTGKWLVWGVSALATVMVIAGGWFATADLQGAEPEFFAFRGFDAVAAFCYVVVALLILHARPSNWLGLLLLGVGTSSAFYWLATQYGLAAELGTRDLPGGAYAAWLQAWGWAIYIVALLSFIPSVFPYGRFHNRLGRPLFGLGLLTIVFAWIGNATRPGPFTNDASYAENPLPIAFLPHDQLETTWGVSLAAIGIGGVATLVRTYRSGGEIERLQLKWLLSAISFLGLSFALIITVFLAAGDWVESTSTFWEFLIFIGILLIPISIGFAITRYRLYDIEIAINRAIVYGPLTAVVAASYVVSVQLARLSFVAVTGERSNSELLVATLVAGAVFWVIRTKMIQIVDRHFKDPREPAKDLRALQANILQMSQIIEPSAVSTERLADHVLTKCVDAFDAAGGRIAFAKGQGRQKPVEVGAIADTPVVSIEIAHDGTAFGKLELGARENDRAYTPRDTEALAAAVAVLAEILSRKVAPKPTRRRSAPRKAAAD